MSGNIAAQKKADHIFEMLGLGKFCGYCFKNPTC